MIKTFKWLGILIGVVIVIILVALGVLAIPGPFFPEEKQYRAITVYSEDPIGQEVDSIMAEVFERLDAVPIYDPNRKLNLCLCSTQDKFTFFSRLTRRSSRTMGFSLLGSSYVNGDFLKELAARSGGRPKYMARAGSIVHVATHELMHGYLSDACGCLASRSLPEWKVEGYCEYGVNQFVAPRDSGYTIQERIDIYLDESQWDPTARTHRPHYIWGLMMEYLVNIQDMSLQQIMADSVTKDAVYMEILDWREQLKDCNQPPDD